VSSRTWAGGACWNYRRRHPLFGDRVWLMGYARYPYVRLRLDDAGGVLLHPGRSQPEIVFAWPEVEKMERVRVFGVPFLGEGVRITLKEVMFWGIPRRLLFFSRTEARTKDILGFAESRGVKVKRRARNMFVVP
jgi:hypothetical protein